MVVGLFAELFWTAESAVSREPCHSYAREGGRAQRRAAELRLAAHRSTRKGSPSAFNRRSVSYYC